MIQKYQLKNGLTVLAVPHRKSPVVSVQMWVRTGSADEGRGEEGISHFIEHLVFKGTRDFKVGEIAKTVEAAGGELNAYTSFDQTVFYVTISKEYFSTALQVVSQMMGYPEFDADEIDNERQVVIEEIKRGQDSLGRQASQQLFKTAFAKSNYRIPVIGFEKNIKKLSAAKIRNYYSSRYTPPNMFLVVAGDFETKAGRKLIEQYFSEIPKTKLEKSKRIREPKQTKTKFAVEKTNFQQSIGYLAWKIPGADHPDIPALDVLAFIWGQGESSRLIKRLRLDEPLANSIGVGNYLPQEGGLMMISMSFEVARLEQILSGILEETEKILTDPPQKEEVLRALVNLQVGEVTSAETVDGLARKFGSAEFQFYNPRQVDTYMKQLRQVTPQEVIRVARKYLKSDQLTISMTVAEEKEQVKKITQNFLKKFKKTLEQKRTSSKAVGKPFKIQKLSFQSKPSRPQVEVLELGDGNRLLLRPSLDTGLVSFRAAQIGGQRAEPFGQEGLAELFSRAWMSGTKSRSESEILRILDDSALQLGPVVGRNSLGMSLECLKTFEKAGAELFQDCFLNPMFVPNVIEREKLLQLEQIKNKKDNPSQIVFQNYLKKMFQDHPYQKESLGTEESLSAINQEKILSYWKTTFGNSKWHFALCGNFDRSFWIETVRELVRHKPRLSQARLAFELSALQSGAVSYEVSKKEQSHLVHGYRSFSMTDDRRFATQLIQSVLAGQGGRLFLELRDKESLAYSVSPVKIEGLEAGTFGAYIGCSPEKVEKALSMMKIEFEKLMQTKLSAEELSRAKKYLIGRHDIELQRTSALSSTLLYEDLYGIDYQEAFAYAEKLEAVSADEIQTVAQNLFSGESVTALVGPTNPLA